MTITTAGRSFYFALAIIILLSSTQALAQSPQAPSRPASIDSQATQQPKTPANPSATVKPAEKQALERTADKIGANNTADKATSEKAAVEKVSVESLVPPAVVPPAPNVSTKRAGTISVPANALSNEQDYEEQAITSVSVGSRFGVRRDPFTRRHKFHSGVDIKARWGDPVGASYAGTVSFVGWHHGYGNLVIVDHGGGIATHYAHLSSFDVEPGEHVERGTILGRAGSTGRATSPHLHYEVRVDGAAVNPFSALSLDADSPYFRQSRLVPEQNGKEPAISSTKQDKQ